MPKPENPVTLRPVVDADEPFLISVYASSRATELAQVDWSPEQKDQFVRWQFGLQRQDYDARYPNAQYSVILFGDEQAGRIWIERDDREIHLLDIAILPEFQNLGIGTVLLQRLIEEAKEKNKPLRHTVFMLNPDAHRLYERLGFVDIQDDGAYKLMEWKAQPD